RVPLPGRDPVPRLHGAGGQLPGRPPDRAARTPEPLEDRLSPDPRHSGRDRRRRAGERLLPGGAVRMVRGPVPRPDAARTAKPGRLRPALPSPARRVRVAPHRHLSLRRPLARACGDRARAGAGADLIGPPGARARRALVAVALAALAGAWTLAALKLWQTSVPDDLSLPNLDPGRYFSQALLDRAASYQAFLRV